VAILNALILIKIGLPLFWGALTLAGAIPFTFDATGISYRSSDGDLDLHLGGYLQIDARGYIGDHPTPEDCFLVRRARPEVKGTLYRHFDFRVLPDFATGSPVLYEAYLEARFQRFTIRGGKFRTPFGLERMQATPNLMFVELGLPTALAPNRDWGVQLSSGLAKNKITYAIGVFHGAADGSLIDAGNNPGLDTAARVFAAPWSNSKDQNRAWHRALKGLGFGMAITAGDQHGPTIGTYKSFGQANFFSYATGTALAGVRVRYAPQAYYYHGSLGILTEYTLSHQVVARSGVDTSVSNSAWQVAGAWLLTGEDKSYRGVDPRRPMFRRGGRGAVEVVARAGQLSLDPILQSHGLANANTPATTAHEWVVGTNWYLNRSLRTELNYGNTRFKGGATPHPIEHALLARMQLVF